MKPFVRGAVTSGAGALLVGASLAILNVTGVSGAQIPSDGGGVRHDSKTSVKCDKSTQCFTVDNSGTGTGIYAVGSTAGVEGEDTGTGGTGVFGQGGTGNSYRIPTGVVGVDDNTGGVGVFGDGAAYGIEGYSESTYGVYGYSLYGEGGLFENDGTSYYTAAVISNASGGFPFLASGTNGAFIVDGSGDGIFSGSVTADGGYKTVIISRSGGKLAAGAAMNAQTTMEDTGTSRLTDGEAAVRFDSAFASTIDANRGYQVFLTPDGDTRGLYVAAKYERGFIVRETERGRSSIAFDYRIVAHPHGISDARLPEVNVNLPRVPAHNAGLRPRFPTIKPRP
ncbi:MAG TPA: hypothetical protein VKR56_08620 [Candidatus Cybelea sp.]|nr:hypothetical protein [Candidatus Cybelea sp.]